MNWSLELAETGREASILAILAALREMEAGGRLRHAAAPADPSLHSREQGRRRQRDAWLQPVINTARLSLGGFIHQHFGRVVNGCGQREPAWHSAC